jgi:hypothetical protein
VTHRRLIATLLVAALTPLPLLAAPPEPPHPPRLGGPLVDGSVIRTKGCGNRFFIAYRAEFVLAQWLGGEMVKDGDVLESSDDQSNFEHEGRMTFTNLATGRTVDVVIEKALLNRADYSRAAAQVCR